MKNRLYLVLVLAALMCLAEWTARAQYTRAVPRQGWKYQQVVFDGPSDMTPRLNQLGNEGWQLVAITSSCTNSANESRNHRNWNRVALTKVYSGVRDRVGAQFYFHRIFDTFGGPRQP